MKCECEHTGHSMGPGDDDHLHDYLGVEATTRVSTVFGTFRVCEPCALDCGLAA